jgi:hypothetical protein
MALQLLVAIYACGAVVVGHLGNGVAVVAGNLELALRLLVAWDGRACDCGNAIFRS